MSLPDPTAGSTVAPSATTLEQPEPTSPALSPIIADAVAHKYYRVPLGMKAARTKRKVGIVFGYVGERYCGLQWNHLPEYPTVEEALLKALYECDMISLTNFSNGKVQQLLNFERASRTDKGVHALRNVVSVCLMLPYHPAYVASHRNDGPEQTENRCEGKDDGAKFSCAEAKRLLNLALPPDIHVYHVVPVARSFNAYMNCCGRIYEYYLPTYALMSKVDYDATYFPQTLAPSRPTPAEVGLTPQQVELYAQKQKQIAANIERSHQEGALPPKGRKTQGHFPKRKGKRTRSEVGDGGGAVDTLEGVEEEGDCDTKPQPASEATPTAEVLATSSKEVEETEGSGEASIPTRYRDSLFDAMLLFRTVPEDAMSRAAQCYRMPPLQLQRVRDLFRQYEGTHCYHNFTPGGRSTDPSCHRYIQRVSVSEPYVVQPDDDRILQSLVDWSPSRFFSPDDRIADEYKAMLQAETKIDGDSNAVTPEARVERLRQHLRDRMRSIYGPRGLEVVRIELDGQSFMLNQIRKMIGAVVCMAATDTPATYICGTLLHQSVRQGVPMAPANGLFLSFLDFSKYNYRLERIQHGGNAGGKQPLDMNRVDEVELQEWRAKTVAVVLRNEMAEDIMGRWMRSLRSVLRIAWGWE